MGLRKTDIAIVTPYRKQVSLIRSMTRNIVSEDDMPLIDTVERLQGQDVDCVIISFAKTSASNVDFIFDRNRLNVMISRAKRKVLFITSNEIGEKLKHLLNIWTNWLDENRLPSLSVGNKKRSLTWLHTEKIDEKNG